MFPLFFFMVDFKSTNKMLAAVNIALKDMVVSGPPRNPLPVNEGFGSPLAT